MLLISRANYSQECINVCEMIVNAFKSVGFVVEFRESVSGAMNYSENLWHRKYEIEDLRQEEEHHCLGEVTKDTNHGKGHSCEVAEGVTHEDFGGEFVVLKQAKSDEDEGDNDGQ